MFAITICQPYPTLIFTPQGDLPAGVIQKRTENRTWKTSHRGLIAIHAGKSKDWLQPGDEAAFPGMLFGAIVGVANLVDCVRVSNLKGRKIVDREVMAKYPWIESHSHADGPICWILENPRPLIEPVRCNGRQGLWPLPVELRIAVETGRYFPE